MRFVFRSVCSSRVARVGVVASGAVLASSTLFAASSTQPAAASSSSSASAPLDFGETKEPYTGCAFRNELDGLQLLGVGLRSKYSYFSVYAYALYAQKDLFANESSSEALFARLIKGDERKLLKLVFQRDITGQDLKDALQV